MLIHDAETWFSLPYPGRDAACEPSPVVWVDSRRDTPGLTFVIFMAPQDLLVKLRELETASHHQCLLGYEVIAFLLETTIQKFSQKYQLQKIMATIYVSINSKAKIM